MVRHKHCFKNLKGCNMFKKLLLVSLLSFGTIQSANAFFVNTNANVSPVFAQFTVWNQWARPIICSGEAYGFTYSGMRLVGYMNRVVIYPGMSGYAEVYTTL
jgi:hypothetical protein